MSRALYIESNASWSTQPMAAMTISNIINQKALLHLLSACTVQGQQDLIKCGRSAMLTMLRSVAELVKRTRIRPYPSDLHGMLDLITRDCRKNGVMTALRFVVGSSMAVCFPFTFWSLRITRCGRPVTTHLLTAM